MSGEPVGRFGLLGDRYRFNANEPGATSDFVIVARRSSYVALIKQAVEASGALVIYRGDM